MTPEQTATTVGGSTGAPVGLVGLVAAPRDLPAVAAPEEFSFAAAGPAAATTARRAPAVALAPLWAAASVATVVLTAFLALIVSGRVVTEGPVVLVLSSTHGIHAGDLGALAAWCLAVGTVLGAALAATVAVRRP